jgi:hypothetical protein
LAIRILIPDGAHGSGNGVLFTSTGDDGYEQIWNLFPMSQGTFFTVIFHLLIGKAAMNAQRLWTFCKECFTHIG